MTGGGAFRVDWTGRDLTLRVGGPAHGGEFVARHEGRVVFCRGTTTGELIRARVTDDPGRAFCRAETTRVVEASDDRVEVACPAAAAGAGCCDWAHIAPGAARGLLARVCTEQFSRIGGIDLGSSGIRVGVPDGDEAATGWRTAARWVTDGEGRPGVRALHSHRVVARRCTQPDPVLWDALRAAAPGPRREVLSVVGDDGEVHLWQRPEVSGARGPVRGSRDRRRGQASRVRARRATAPRWERLAGAGPVVRTVDGTRWELGPESFWQSHRSAARHYAHVVGVAASGCEASSVWDLYGGAGLFAAAVRDSHPGAHVRVVESSPHAVAAGRSAFEGLEDVEFARADVADELTGGADRPAVSASPPDLVVVDPPRSGAGRAVMHELSTLGARRVVHVGCDAASAARDVGVLAAQGWRVVSVDGVAAFPGTHHVETVTVLDAP